MITLEGALEWLIDTVQRYDRPQAQLAAFFALKHIREGADEWEQ
jgi:hypothetical protein